ncbi:MAG: lysophospholipid acyltransferase family protein [Pseudomonadota bacterium]
MAKHSQQSQSSGGWPALGPDVPRRGARWMASLSRWVLERFRWRLKGDFPNEPKLVIIAAPHQSNWDWALAMLLLFSLRLRMNWMAKHTLFSSPLGGFFRWLGGIPVNRHAAKGVVEQAASDIRAAAQFVLAIAPEGTRQNVKHFKSGFYRIAAAAQVPILPVLIDYPNRVMTFLEPVVPNEDPAEAVPRIEALFDGVRHP